MLSTSSIFIFLNVLAMTPPPTPPGIIQNIAYEITDLGFIPGFPITVPVDMNNEAQIIGYSDNGGGTELKYFLYQQGEFTEISIENQIGGFGGAINDLGIITGFLGISDLTMSGASLWQNGEITDLGTLGGRGSDAMGINNLNQVVGRSSTLSGSSHAFLWQDGVMIDINDLLPDTTSWILPKAIDINDSGVIVGSTSLSTVDHSTGFVMTTIPPIEITDLGFLPGSEDTFPQAINEHGDVVGWSDLNPDRSTNRRAFLWSNGTLIDLGTFSEWSSALDINKWRQVVGFSVLENFSSTHAFIWFDGTMYDLNDFIHEDTGWVLRSATSINDEGVIVGTGIFNGNPRAYLLSPCKDANKDKLCDSSNDCPANNNPGQNNSNPDCGKPDDTPPNLEIPMCGMGALPFIILIFVALSITKLYHYGNNLSI